MIQLNQHNDNLKVQFESNLDDFSLETITNFVSLDSIDLILRECLDIDEMREAGSFFTGQQLASKLIDKFDGSITTSSVFLDPTCGAGNLLIECSRKLEIKAGLAETLYEWGKVLHGMDIHNSFIEACKLRLIFEAMNRGAKKDCPLQAALDLLPSIRVADVMATTRKDFDNITHVAMNPPFTSWTAPKNSFWKKGKVNSAGVVFEHIIELIPCASKISAILPDVLRSGSRYSKWREYTACNFSGLCEIHGRFNKKTDVDVFILSGEKRYNIDNNILWSPTINSSEHRTLSDEYKICIGPLVSYREPKIGNSYPYIHPRTAPSWGTMTTYSEYRQFSGKVFKPPFVVIRRTSSPSDNYRAVGTLITGNEFIAVENHMIILKPLSGGLNSCKKLMALLKSDETSIFLNENIRLRHLTIDIVKRIPMK